jgi:valyl-tRNA synthetase
MLSDWPVANKQHVQPEIENQFSQFTALLGAIREIRSRQNIAPKESLECYVRCNAATEKLLAPMKPFLQSMAGATVVEWSESPAIPSVQAHMPLEGMDVYVDLGKFIDVDAEIARNTKLLENLVKQIQGKEGKLSNESFVARAPADVVRKERESLDELINQRVSTEAALEKLRAM